MKAKNKVILGIGLLVALAAAYLSVFMLVSTSHAVAKYAIVRSNAVIASVGNVNAVGLVGVRQKLVPGGASCTYSTYIAFGEEGFEFITVQMSMRTGDRDWVVTDLSVGWFTNSSKAC